MYFKKLEILGFKSFAEKTLLHFEPGITAIVGPNGCGKSNIFDAMRWVLGEQSVKSLRGTRMEDVIFNGTESIPALGYAEVSLTFANEAKALPIDYDEVTVTRRLFRSGESEYLMNKTAVRLKDITELFMGTGIGAESYSLVEQGKIDLILSSRPEDRRLVFDEAAGISKYKSQKREAVRKLEDTEANLLRINDIITEVKRQINSLERQAAKARRYKEVYEKLKGLETQNAAFQIYNFQAQLDNINLELTQLITLESDYTRSIDQLNREFWEKEQTLGQSEENLNNLNNQASSFGNIVLRNGQQLTFNIERKQELQSRIEILATQKIELEQKIAQGEERIRNFKSGLDFLVCELDEKKTKQHRLDFDLDEINKSITLTQHNIKESKAKILEFASHEATLNNQVLELTERLHQTIARKKRLDIEKFKAEEEFSSTESALEDAALQEEAAFKIFNELKNKNEELKNLYNQSQHEKEALQSFLTSLENEKLGLESQKEFLSNLKLRYENITESTNATLLLDTLSDTKISGIIVKVNEVSKLDANDVEIAKEAKIKVRGIAKPISLDPQEMINKIAALASDIDKAKDGLDRKTTCLEELSLQLANSEKELRLKDIEYNNKKIQKDNISQQFDKLKEETNIILSETKETDIELNSLKDEEKKLTEGLIGIKEEARLNQQAIEKWLEDVALKNSKREGLVIAVTQIKAEIFASEEKVRTASETFNIYEETCKKDKSDYELCLTEETNSKTRIQELSDSTSKLQVEIKNAQEQKELLLSEIERISSILSLARVELKGLQSKIEECKNRLDQNKTKVHELQMRLQELNYSQNSIRERIFQVYKVSPEDLTPLYRPDLNIEETTQEVDLLKQKIDSYGQVNLVAIEEFEELKQRHDFLISQHEDLIKSKESLHEAILKINRTTKKMFLETFEKLAVEFKNYFRLLFGGGDAQLFLIDEQDVLESGIEIVCRPPGKKLQNVLLLSGGEKSMSAIALLFAIFKVKPSPFCVLDEIDAALDEANVDRFSRMLVEFTSQTQFIVITHNKKTIANADIMYGITMEKAGISKIVSVKLADNKKKEDKILASA